MKTLKKIIDGIERRYIADREAVLERYTQPIELYEIPLAGYARSEDRNTRS